MPVTRTSVTVATATASWTMPERHVRVAASRTVFRRIGKPSTIRPYPSAAASPARNAAAPPCEGWRTYGPPMRACATLPIAITRRPSESSARNGALASISTRVGGRFELSVPGCVGTTFQRRTSLSIPSSCEHRVDDRRGRLGRPGAGELALRGQRNARDARPAIAGRLGDEEEPRVRRLSPDSAASRSRRSRGAGVLVERLADPRRCESLDKAPLHRTSLEAVQRRRVVVQGHVQGVFFRETTRRRAQTAGVSGWARNLPDGSVEAVFEGERDAVERLVEFAREGPRGARVDWVDVVSEEPEGLEGFSVALALGRADPVVSARPAGRSAVEHPVRSGAVAAQAVPLPLHHRRHSRTHDP